MFQFVDDSTKPFSLEVNHALLGVHRVADVAIAVGASIEVSHLQTTFSQQFHLVVKLALVRAVEPLVHVPRDGVARLDVPRLHVPAAAVAFHVFLLAMSSHSGLIQVSLRILAISGTVTVWNNKWKAR